MKDLIANIEHECRELDFRLDILGTLAKQANDDSCYWQGLYKSLASDKDYNASVNKLVKDHRKRVKQKRINQNEN